MATGQLRRLLLRGLLAVFPALLLASGSAQALSFGPDLSQASATNPYTCSFPFSSGIYRDGCTAVDVLTGSMSTVLPDPVANGNQSGVVTAIHILSAATEPVQFVVVEYAAHPGVADTTFVSGVSAVSQQVTLHPGMNNFNTNLPVDFVLSPSGFERWSVIGLTIADGYPIPGQLGGSFSETGLLLDNYEPLTTTIPDITVPPHNPMVSGYEPMALLMSGDVTPAPSSTAGPSITGTPTQGQTLSEAHGTWSGSPTAYAYQWEDCDIIGGNCVAITGATGQTYSLGAGDVGHTIRVQETASNVGGAGSPATSLATTVVKSGGGGGGGGGEGGGGGNGGGGGGVTIPALTTAAAQADVAQILGQRFGNAFMHRGGYKISCASSSQTQVGCSVSWRSGAYHYAGQVNVANVLQNGAVALTSSLRIKRVTQSCFAHPKRGCKAKIFT